MTENEMYEQICFYPFVDVDKAFNKAEAIKEGQKNELESLRTFYKSMKFFYDYADIQDGDVAATGENMIKLYEYAKKGAGIE